MRKYRVDASLAETAAQIKSFAINRNLILTRESILGGNYEAEYSFHVKKYNFSLLARIESFGLSHYVTIHSQLTPKEVRQFKTFGFIAILTSFLTLFSRPFDLTFAILSIFFSVALLKFFELGVEVTFIVSEILNSIEQDIAENLGAISVDSSPGLLFTRSPLASQRDELQMQLLLSASVIFFIFSIGLPTLTSFLLTIIIAGLIKSILLLQVEEHKLTHVPAIAVKQMHAWNSLGLLSLTPLILFYYIHVFVKNSAFSTATPAIRKFYDSSSFSSDSVGFAKEYIRWVGSEFLSLFSGTSPSSTGIIILRSIVFASLTGIIYMLIVLSMKRFREALHLTREWYQRRESEAGLYFSKDVKQHNDLKAFSKWMLIHYSYNVIINFACLYVMVELFVYVVADSNFISPTLHIIFIWVEGAITFGVMPEGNSGIVARAVILLLFLPHITFLFCAILYGIKSLFYFLRFRRSQTVVPKWIQDYIDRVSSEEQLSDVRCICSSLGNGPIYTDHGGWLLNKREIVIHTAFLEVTEKELVKIAITHELGHIKLHERYLRFTQTLSNFAIFSRSYLVLILNSPQLEIEADRFAYKKTGSKEKLKKSITATAYIYDLLLKKQNPHTFFGGFFSTLLLVFFEEPIHIRKYLSLNERKQVVDSF